MLKHRRVNLARTIAVLGIFAISLSRPPSAAPQATAELLNGSPLVINTYTLFRPSMPSAQALLALDQLVKKRPSWEVYVRRAFIRYLTNQFAAAAQDCDQSLKLLINPAAYYLLAASSVAQGPKTWPRAIQAANKLIDQYPDLSYPYECASFVTALQGDFETSIQQLAAYSALAAESGRGHYHVPDPGCIGKTSAVNMAKLIASVDKSQKQRASPQLLQALAAFFADDYVRAQMILGAPRTYKDKAVVGRISEGDLALALSISIDQMLKKSASPEEKALQLVRQTDASEASLTLLDITYFGLGQREKALEFLNKCIEKEAAKPNRAQDNAREINMLYMRAAIHQKLEQPKLALADAEAICKIDPAQKKALLQACELRLVLGEKDRALADLNKYIRDNQAEAGAHFLRAQFYVMDSKWSQAVHDLSLAIAAGYHLEKTLRARAACYRAMHLGTLASDDIALVDKFRTDYWVVRDFRKLKNN